MVRVCSRSRAALAALSLAVSLLCAAPAGAQVTPGLANCVWLKLKAKASGYEREGVADGLGPKRGASATCYLQLVAGAANAGNPFGTYGGPLLCQIDFESWTETGAEESYAGAALGDGNVLSESNFLTFHNAAGDVIQGYTSARLAISVDKLGAFRKASFSSFSGELSGDSLYNTTPAYLFGSFSVKGSSLPEDKVPEEARALVAGGACPPAAP